ncbi:hypothetical protein Tco_1517322 [Tanacetum coccineum]
MPGVSIVQYRSGIVTVKRESVRTLKKAFLIRASPDGLETNQAKVQEQDAKDKKRHISGKTKRKQQRKAQRRKASIQARGQAKQERAGKHEKKPFDKDEKPYKEQ